ncbi:MAG: hypothetical protein BMS9Abin22_297 [Gammaproteobacteria bacterium]|nr:MAG: hypothetical protein BMS9Abin22_297 [Gammaproteobacteria bacterium]
MSTGAQAPTDGFVARHDGTFAISGLLTFETVPEFLSRTSTWLSSGPEMITIDMKNVSKADSAGLALMVEWLRQAREAKRRIRFVNIPEQLNHLIRVSGLQRAFATR